MGRLTDTGHAGWLFGAGATLLLAGNLAHPVDADPTHLSRVGLAGPTSWVIIHLVIAAGMLSVAAGMVAVARSAGGRRPAVARVLEVAAIVGGASMAVVFAGLDGYGAHVLAEAHAAAATPQELAGVESAALALDAIDSGAGALGTLLLMGVGFGLTGVALAGTWAVPPWLAGGAVLVGAAGTATGLAFFVVGPTGTTINVMLRPTAVGATLVSFGLAAALSRRGASAADPEPATPLVSA